jgi:hypothetical protein
LDSTGQWTAGAPAAFGFAQYRIEATSPGEWANGTRVTIRYCLRGTSGRPEVDIVIQAPYEPAEYFAGLTLDALESQIASQSLLIRLIPNGPPAQSCLLRPGPHYLEWELILQGGTEKQPSTQDYLQAARKLGEDDTVASEQAPSLEVALVVVPGLYEELLASGGQEEVLVALIAQAEQLHDRLVLVDVPPDQENPDDALKDATQVMQWVTRLRGLLGDGPRRRAAAVYHPRLWVPDPLGGIAKPLRSVPPSGHIAGVISGLDRQRGAHHTPANISLLDAVDVTRTFEKAEQARFNDAGINLVRCFPGRGLVVWGGRTLETEREGRFIAHRRLIHRILRTIRRVAEPLVFETNGPELWLTIVRAITTVLLEAWRAGALQGARPEEAFRVRCDEQTISPEAQELGQVICEIEVAPAVPMEFILLRIALSSDGILEVFES